ncbi:CYTH domain-containing protein [Terrilactibacillus sp. S3-3]|nr:CYTH domain-containing protein [Terrilactibacillus sp. S3-3]
MSQELEIEFKNMLTREEFDDLCRRFNISDHAFFRQTNDYFDTADFKLRRAKTALRIRRAEGRFDFTLKQPHDGVILETHQPLSEEEAGCLINTGKFPQGDVCDCLVRQGIHINKLDHLGTLTTRRAQFPYKNGELFLDHSFYFDHEDYELEFEAADRAAGRQVFAQLLSACRIPERPSLNKILRFYHYKKGMER